MVLLPASGSLSQRALRPSSLGVRSVSLGAATSAVGTSLTPPKISVSEVKTMVRSVLSLVGSGRERSTLGTTGSGTGFGSSLVTTAGAGLTATGVSASGLTSAGRLPKKYHASAPRRPRPTRGRSQPGRPELSAGAVDATGRGAVVGVEKPGIFASESPGGRAAVMLGFCSAKKLESACAVSDLPANCLAIVARIMGAR